ncbi:hypothetical protein D2L64_02100 [Micromonospora radicis]|uniref:Uncharacterized protein n=1 Tax=Micromonospora radicis TaxID=1894971 RepID=A0A418N1K4_9ACTN|nr:hypothetical protein D2L64_02100 [Micromonospora radicis]
MGGAAVAPRIRRRLSAAVGPLVARRGSLAVATAGTARFAAGCLVRCLPCLATSSGRGPARPGPGG